MAPGLVIDLDHDFDFIIRTTITSGAASCYLERKEELLDRHVVKKQKSYDDDKDERLTRQRLTTTRREVLSLYRDIIRATRFFMWADSRGEVWRDVLRANARKEFEEARFEKDPEVITRLLLGGHDAVQAALDKLVEKQRQQIAKEQADRDCR
uniref:Complex 1 LYR protein n=1 Tax=Tanacetum cinerariifolium TaxID=118510 RepID=A0A6L2K1S5_TANCI|nr:complex 1 LYR protein [Tanacetum cinerariifolium]